MPAKRRNFWVLLTVFAVMFAGVRWLSYKERSCVSSCHKPTTLMEKRILPQIDAPVRVDREPVVKNMTEVKRSILYSYPCSVRRYGIEGSVVARVLVDENGRYLRHRIISRSNCGLAHRCDRYLAKLDFVPAIRNHHPVPAWTNVELSFPY